MKKVVLKKQYPLFPYYPPGTELSFVADEQADGLVDKGIADYKSIEKPTKDKMIRRSKTK
jgi:hypothetical protein